MKILTTTTLLLLALASALRAQTTTLYDFEFGEYAGSTMTWTGGSTTAVTPTAEAVALRVVADTANGASLEGAWVTIVTRIRYTGMEDVPSWLTTSGGSLVADTVVPQNPPTSSDVWNSFSAATRTRFSNGTTMAHGPTAYAFLNSAYGTANPITAFWQAGLENEDEYLNWEALPAYWGTGFGAQRWGNTYQSNAAGYDQFNLVRVAEMAMVYQAGSVAAVQNFLRTATYSDILQEDELELVLQPIVLRRASHPFVLTISDVELPEGPDDDDEDITADFVEPIVISLPISKFDATLGKSVSSTPGAFADGDQENDTLYLFAGLAMDVNTIRFPVDPAYVGDLGYFLEAVVTPADENFPDSGIYKCTLPTDLSKVDGELEIQLLNSTSTIDGSVFGGFLVEMIEGI